MILTIELFKKNQNNNWKLFKLSSVFCFSRIIEPLKILSLFTTVFISIKYGTKFLNIKYGSCPFIIAHRYNVKLQDLGSNQFNENAETCLSKHDIDIFYFPTEDPISNCYFSCLQLDIALNRDCCYLMLLLNYVNVCNSTYKNLFFLPGAIISNTSIPLYLVHQPNMRNLSLKLRTLNTLTEFN